VGLTLLAVAFDAEDPRSVAEFWGALLARELRPDGDGWVLPGSATQVGLQFVPVRPDTNPGGRRLHLHVTSETLAAQGETVEHALRLGAQHRDVGQRPEEGHIVLADPGGNEFCVIAAGNAYLAGTGRLGEVTCDGTQAVGHFWSSALGWPLVWDQDEETAIQSPAGGTKIAWGGPPMAAKRGRNPQHFVLEVGAAEREREVARLTGLGARHTSPPSDGPAELTDPDGNEFVVRAR